MLAVGAELRRNTATAALVETLWLADDPARILQPKTQGGGDDDRRSNAMHRHTTRRASQSSRSAIEHYLPSGADRLDRRSPF
jgi:hypothetical protein